MKEVAKSVPNERLLVRLILIRKLNPIKNKTTDMVSVGKDSLMKVYSKHPVISVIKLIAAMEKPICRQIFLITKIKQMLTIISNVVVAQ